MISCISVEAGSRWLAVGIFPDLQNQGVGVLGAAHLKHISVTRETSGSSKRALSEFCPVWTLRVLFFSEQKNWLSLFTKNNQMFADNNKRYSQCL